VFHTEDYGFIPPAGTQDTYATAATIQLNGL